MKKFGFVLIAVICASAFISFAIISSAAASTPAPTTTLYASTIMPAASFVASATPASPTAPRWETIMYSAMDWILEATPDGARLGGVVGEWAIRAMARAEKIDAHSPWLETWLGELNAAIIELEAENNPAALRRWTDFQRVSLALDALGLDVRNYRGFDFTAPFAVFVAPAQRNAANRTILADIYALISLEAILKTTLEATSNPASQNFTTNAEARRYFNALIQAQRADGTWSLNPASPTSVFDIDVTAMALQALAPFYHAGNRTAIQAVERAMLWLSAQTFRDPESTAQMIVAMTLLGENYAQKAAYYVQWLLRWYSPQLGGFVRTNHFNAVNAMATVQAVYALTAFQQFVYELGYEPTPPALSNTRTPPTNNNRIRLQ